MVTLEFTSGDEAESVVLDATKWLESASEKDVIAFTNAVSSNDFSKSLHPQDVAATLNNQSFKELMEYQFRFRTTDLVLNETVDEDDLHTWVSKKYPESYVREVLRDKVTPEAIGYAFGEYTTDTLKGNEVKAWILMEFEGLLAVYNKFEIGANEEYQYFRSYELERKIKQTAWEQQQILNAQTIAV